jgi:hypothetical protein
MSVIRKKEVLDMATSSITKNFVVSGDRQAEILANAIEASANSETPPIGVSVTELHGTEAIRKFLERRKK